MCFWWWWCAGSPWGGQHAGRVGSGRSRKSRLPALGVLVLGARGGRGAQLREDRRLFCASNCTPKRRAGPGSAGAPCDSPRWPPRCPVRSSASSQPANSYRGQRGLEIGTGPPRQRVVFPPVALFLLGITR